MVKRDAQKNDQTFSTFFSILQVGFSICLAYFSPKSHETGPKVLVLAQAMPRAKKAKLNHMLLVGGQILVTHIQNKSFLICSVTELFMKFVDKNSRKFVNKVKFSCY